MGLRLKKMLSRVIRSLRGPVQRSIRRVSRPSLPRNPDGKVLIHIGCGDQNDSRYINVDTRPLPHVHHVGSVFDIDRIFPAGQADLIYMCHVLEHVSHRQLPAVLRKLHRCLKRGGVLRLSVPDFDRLTAIYREEGRIEAIIKPLMGGQENESYFHRSLFTGEYLTALLRAAGFVDIRRWQATDASYHDFDDWSRRKHRFQDKEWFVSLNLEARKE